MKSEVHQLWVHDGSPDRTMACIGTFQQNRASHKQQEAHEIEVVKGLYQRGAYRWWALFSFSFDFKDKGCKIEMLEEHCSEPQKLVELNIEAKKAPKPRKPKPKLNIELAHLEGFNIAA